MNWIKKYFINYQIRHTPANSSKADEVDFSAVREITLIADSEQDMLDTKSLCYDLWGKEIKINDRFFSLKRGKVILEKELTPSDFSFFGHANIRIRTLLDQKPSLILVSSENLNPYLQFILHLQSKIYRVGFYSSSNSPFLDLMLNHDPQLDKKGNMANMIQYIKKIHYHEKT
ncbi:DUF6913 domain-containing protein [Pararhodonellum marinum]|uniref:DUF6913 domain-containing protein n=1 Tax=Pararhodonellum marinum TaxID=2755358 RepID=UPI00188DC8AE|nr:hypothetical protein [Pararhodonellum marinum]